MARKRVAKRVKKAKKERAKAERERREAKSEKELEKEDLQDLEEDFEDEDLDEEEREALEEVMADELELPEYSPNPKPKLDDDVRKALALRKEKKKKQPKFIRQEAFRYKRVPNNWRRPKGLHSKMRRHRGYRPNVVSIGYRGPRKARGLHPSGFREVLVHNVKEAEAIDPEVEAIRIAKGVGTKKREAIEERVSELEEENDVRYYILNPLKDYDIVNVHQPSDLELLDRSEQAAYIPPSVGKRMRRAIINKAREMAESRRGGVKILNAREDI